MQDDIPLVEYSTKIWRWFVRTLASLARNQAFRRWYAVGAVATLLVTTVFWAVLGARLQIHNADQLSDPYMFSSWSAFHQAYFPSAHTFLLKWPIFWLVGLLGVSQVSLLAATVGVVVATVAAIALVLYKIDRRPLVFGTVSLGLALALLLVPTQPYAGGILPVNMAMLTTRNLEYAVYLAVLVLFARAKQLRSRSFVLGVGLLALLVASDKLFVSLSVGGALAALFVYALFGNWAMAAYAVRWLSGSIMAVASATLVLAAIAATHLTHLLGATAGPYGLVRTAQDLVLGVVYAAAGVLTNAGANPAYDSTVLRQLPTDFMHRLLSIGGAVYVVALAALGYGFLMLWRQIYPTFRPVLRRSRQPVAHLFSLSLTWSALAALGVFVLTKHYYAVDARYLAIWLLAVVVAVSVGLRKRQWPRPESVLLIACVFVVAIGAASVVAIRTSSHQMAALSELARRNHSIADALKHHEVDVLVSDYWRAFPIKLASHETVQVMPMQGCTTPAEILTSGVWQYDLAKHSFAYLVTLNGGLTGFPACTLAEITTAYGRPNATQIIAGTVLDPQEALLFYDQGSRPPQRSAQQAVQTSLLPASLSALADTKCDQPTTVNIVAHQDDDLLFLSPDLLHDIQAGRCVRTIFLTAGDSGHDTFYWLSRQLGAEAAYSQMLGTTTVWDHQTVRLGDDEYVTVAAPRDNPKVSLVFFNLPDGNLYGQGFSAYEYQSLAQLYEGNIDRIQTVDGQSSYSSAQLVSALGRLLRVYQPAGLHTLADVPGGAYPDHSDHIHTSLYAQTAATLYDRVHLGSQPELPVTRYTGYPIQAYPSNISDEELGQKAAAFFAYGQYDNAVCRSIVRCAQGSTYGAYLSRQYQE